MAVFKRKLVCCRFERLSTTIWTHRQTTTKNGDLGQLWTFLVKPIKDLIPTWSSLSSRKIYKNPLTGEAMTRNCVTKFYKQASSSSFRPNNLVHISIYFGSEKTNIHSLKKSMLCLIEAVEKLRIRTFCSVEACALYRFSIWSPVCAPVFIDAWQFETNKQKQI